MQLEDAWRYHLTHESGASWRLLLDQCFNLLLIASLPLFVVAKLASMVARLAVGGMFPGWSVMLAPLVEAMLGPLATIVLLAPQRRPPDPDEARPP